MSDDKKNRRGAKGSSGAGGDDKADRDIGHALRSVYSKTVSEDVPPEFLDLLGKLS